MSLGLMAVIGHDGTVGAHGDMSDRARLRLVGDGDKPESEIGLGTVPLGPWAGASVEVWTSRAGQVWHADPDCAELRTRGRHAVHQQPTSGSLAELDMPDRLHCPPVGELGDYRSAAGYLVVYESASRSAGEALTRGDLGLREAVRFVEGRSTVNTDRGRVLETGALAPRWAAAQRERRSLADRIRETFAADGQRTARICAAAWVHSGRTPREHQDRYATFLDAGVKELARHSVSYQGYARDVVNRDRLPTWLDIVGDGLAPAAATASIASGADDRADGSGDPIVAAWTAVGQRWEAMLDGVTLGFPSELVAVFHRYGLRHPLWKLLPHASIKVDELDWVVAQLPAAARPLLAERDRGLIGLVLDDEHGHLFDADRCALLLRNILISVECQQLCDLVATGPGTGVEQVDGDEDRPVCPLSWQQVGFASGVGDHGTTRELCLPAVRAAMQGTALPAGRTSRRRR